MNAVEIEAFCEQFFQHANARLIRKEQGYLEVELPIDIDKELTDRPYYWLWVEATGEEVQPTILRLAFEPDVEIEGVDQLEFVPLGSFRLNKIFDAVKRRGMITRQFERSQRSISTGNPLWPVLLIRVKVSYIADQCQQRMRTFAINLVNRHVYIDADALLRRDFTAEPEGPYLEPTTQLHEAWRLLRDDIVEQVMDEDHAWATEARERLNAELTQLETYYESLIKTASGDELCDRYRQERDLRKTEVEWRCQPRIEVDPTQVAILFVGILSN